MAASPDLPKDRFRPAQAVPRKEPKGPGPESVLQEGPGLKFMTPTEQHAIDAASQPACATKQQGEHA